MAVKKPERGIQTRRDLFDFLQGQMQTNYDELTTSQRHSHDSNLIKSYIFEANIPSLDTPKMEEQISSVFRPLEDTRYSFKLHPTEEENFFKIEIRVENHELHLFLDSATDSRFWLAYSVSESQALDRWLQLAARRCINFDFAWLWPHFLERVQEKGKFRGFGLDYDYRKFENEETESTTYLKMQLWGGENTKKIYELLQNDNDFRSKVVLSKVRFKEYDKNDQNQERFAIQDVKFNGKFTARGTDLETHLLTLNDVRKRYKETIQGIEQRCSLRWVENSIGGTSLEGYAIHFLPDNFEIPVSLLIEKMFDGADPFRLLGFPNFVDEYTAAMEVVDLHTGGKLSVDINPEMLTVYLPESTCGNTIARLFTNIQHSFNVGFRVETDDGEKLFD